VRFTNATVALVRSPGVLSVSLTFARRTTGTAEQFVVQTTFVSPTYATAASSLVIDMELVRLTTT
jgi:hypothetical protein